MKDAFVHDQPTVFVLDSDRAVRDTVKSVTRQLQLNVELYHAAGDFFSACGPQRRGCLLADVHMPDVRGTEVAGWLSDKGIHLPVILLATRPEVAAAVRAIKAGAFHYLRKPCEHEELAEVVQEAIVWDAANRRRLAFCAKVRRRLKRLNQGERQVLELLADGRSNKGIAAELGVSIRAIEVRRAKLMKKMYVQSLAELVRATVMVCDSFGESHTFAEG